MSMKHEKIDTTAAASRERLLEQQLRENGIEPWASPGEDEE
jgi:hypothetical protein